MYNLLDLLENGRVLHDTHADELLCSPVLIENVVRELAKLLHVGSDKHLAELDKVAVVLVIDLHDTPRVRTTANLAAVKGLDNPVRANNRERDLAGNLLGLRNSLLVLVLVRRGLEDLNLVVGNVCEYLEHSTSLDIGRITPCNETYPGLEVSNLIVREGVCLRNDRNQVHPGVKLTHELDINRFEPR